MYKQNKHLKISIFKINTFRTFFIKVFKKGKVIYAAISLKFNVTIWNESQTLVNNKKNKNQSILSYHKQPCFNNNDPQTMLFIYGTITMAIEPE